jgi:hypothetical protein
MKDPRRLLDGDGTEEQRALLRAGVLEEPTADGRARLLAALGVAAASAGEVTAQAQSSAVSGGLTAGSGAASAIKLAVLAVGSAALLGAGALLWARSEQPAGGDAAKSTGESAAQRQGDERDQATPKAEAPGTVALEIEALERVRSELARKDGQAALTALGGYASVHPHGVLAHEADVLRVEALVLEGDAAAALELAKQLLGRHGDSPHRARLEALARQASAPSTP